MVGTYNLTCEPAKPLFWERPMSSIEIVRLIMSAAMFLAIVGGVAFIVWDSLREVSFRVNTHKRGVGRWHQAP